MIAAIVGGLGGGLLMGHRQPANRAAGDDQAGTAHVGATQPGGAAGGTSAACAVGRPDRRRQSAAAVSDAASTECAGGAAAKSEPANVPAPQPKIEPANAPAAQAAAVHAGISRARSG